MTHRIFLTLAVALALLVVLTGLVALSAMCPLWTLATMPALAANGWAGAEAVSTIWNPRNIPAVPAK